MSVEIGIYLVDLSLIQQGQVDWKGRRRAVESCLMEAYYWGELERRAVCRVWVRKQSVSVAVEHSFVFDDRCLSWRPIREHLICMILNSAFSSLQSISPQSRKVIVLLDSQVSMSY